MGIGTLLRRPGMDHLGGLKVDRDDLGTEGRRLPVPFSMKLPHVIGFLQPKEAFAPERRWPRLSEEAKAQNSSGRWGSLRKPAIG